MNDELRTEATLIRHSTVILCVIVPSRRRHEKSGRARTDGGRIPPNLVASIKAPLLIVHGEDDTTVPIEQAHLMASALKNAGHPAETLYFAEVGHWWPTEKKGAQFLQRIESFLADAMK